MRLVDDTGPKSIPFCDASEVKRLEREIDRRIEAYKIAHDQAMENGATAARLRAALEPFASLTIMNDRLSGLDPEQIRHHVAEARRALAPIEAEGGDVKQAPSR